MIWHTAITVADLNQRMANTIGPWIGIEFTEVAPNYLMAKMPVDERTQQPLGLLHGGSSCVLAESIGSSAANMVVDPAIQYCVGLEINVNHIRSVRSGWVTGKAFPYHLGRKTQVWGIEITDELGKMVAISRLTMAVIDKQPIEK